MENEMVHPVKVLTPLELLAITKEPQGRIDAEAAARAASIAALAERARSSADARIDRLVTALEEQGSRWASWLPMWASWCSRWPGCSARRPATRWTTSRSRSARIWTGSRTDDGWGVWGQQAGQARAAHQRPSMAPPAGDDPDPGYVPVPREGMRCPAGRQGPDTRRTRGRRPEQQRSIEPTDPVHRVP